MARSKGQCLEHVREACGSSLGEPEFLSSPRPKCGREVEKHVAGGFSNLQPLPPQLSGLVRRYFAR